MRLGRGLAIVGAGLAVAAVVPLGRSDQRDPRTDTGAPVARPNFLVITTDDQTLSQFSAETMPFTTAFFERRGSVFTQAIAAPPLCCPSRAGFLTGQYPHNHGVLTNDAGYQHLRGKANTLPVWLDRAGYRTAMIGKYLNGYPVFAGPPPPGWDRWFAAGGSIDYVDFDVATENRTRHFGGERYSTAVYTRAARRVISHSADAGEPFFAWLTYNAPHAAPGGTGSCAGSTPQPQTAADYRPFARAPLPASPALDERDVSDKGRWIRDKAPIGKNELRVIQRRWRCALSSLPAVDRGIRSLVAELHRTRQLERTIIVFTSDNGYFFGEHAVAESKELPYDPALRVPLAAFLPTAIAGSAAPTSVAALVSNVDVAPTLLDYARARPCRRPNKCRTLDGRSLRPLLEGQTPDWTGQRAIPLELDDDFTYEAFRTADTLYMELTKDRMGPIARPEVELYDLRADPDQLHNLAVAQRDAHRARLPALRARLHRVSSCAGTAGPEACE